MRTVMRAHVLQGYLLGWSWRVWRLVSGLRNLTVVQFLQLSGMLVAVEPLMKYNLVYTREPFLVTAAAEVRL